MYIGNNIQLNFTISIGVSQLDPEDVDLHLLIKEADVALYRAKQNGRNQVVCFDSLPNEV